MIRMLKFPQVPKLSHIDTSDTQSEQIIREIKQLRIESRNNAVDLIHEIQEQKSSSSPYAPDRGSFNQKIQDSSTENSWKDVPTYEEERNIKLNLKKLNIL